MKKLLLIAALAAIAFGANADGYKLEKVWEFNTASVLTTADVRQGFGMDGKFYINDKAAQAVYVIDENGLANTTYPGGANCGITRDEAGNLVISNAVFPGVWAEATVKVVNPTTGEVKEYLVPEECGLGGRSDMFGFAKGDMMEDGVLYFTGAATDGICILTIAGGEVAEDDCYMATCDGLNNTSSTVINFFRDINNEETLIYDYRSGMPSKLTADGDNFARVGFALPNLNDVSKKGHANGVFPFIWDGKELYLYTLMPDYREGFAVAEANAEAPIVAVEAELQANPNAFQANWLNAEVDENGVTIYQYVPGYSVMVWRLTKDEPQPEIPNVYILGEVNEQGWAPNVGLLMEYDADNGVYTANVKLDGRGQDGENYFSFTTELAEYNDDGSWAYIAPFRFGAVSEGDFVYDDTMNDTPLSLTYDNPQAFRANGGNYEIIVNLNDMTVTMHHWLMGDANHDKVIDVSDVTALIAAVLGNTPEGFFFDEGNCSSEDDLLDVSDVTALIAIVLGN